MKRWLAGFVAVVTVGCAPGVAPEEAQRGTTLEFVGSTGNAPIYVLQDSARGATCWVMHRAISCLWDVERPAR